MNEQDLRRVSVMLVRIDYKEKNYVKFTRYGELAPKVHYITQGSKIPFDRFIVGDYYVVTSALDGIWTWQNAWPIDIEAQL